MNDGEYKIMGLAPYGEPRYAQRIYDHLLDLKDDGSFRLDLDYFGYCTGLTMTNQRFDELHYLNLKGFEWLKRLGLGKKVSLCVWVWVWVWVDTHNKLLPPEGYLLPPRLPLSP